MPVRFSYSKSRAVASGVSVNLIPKQSHDLCVQACGTLMNIKKRIFLRGSRSFARIYYTTVFVMMESVCGDEVCLL